MSLPNDLSNIGSIANGIVNSITANSTAITTIIANGSFGTANQVLSSNGTSLYWGDVAAGATFVRQTFTANSTVNTTFTITNGYTVNAIDVYENGIKLIVGTEVTANNGTSITLATSALNNSTVDVVGLLSASIFSLNINTVSQGFAFSWTNNHVFNSNVDFYSSLTANTISVGNSTVNSVINSTSLTANAIIANGSITVGNSTVNSVINSTSISAAVIDLNTGTAIASASTINLNTATGNRVHVTGTTTITAVTLTRGPRTVIFDGILTLTHHATTNNLPGAANITTAAGDRAIYESDGTTVFCISYTKASGAPLVSASGVGFTPNSKSSDYTFVLGDAGDIIVHPATDTAFRTWTIPANASVAYPIGTTILLVVQQAAGRINLVITTDTLRTVGGATGKILLVASTQYLLVKVAATEWLVQGGVAAPSRQMLAITHDTAPYVTAYPWSSAGFGTKFTNPATLPAGAAGQSGAAAFSPAGTELAIAHATSPYVTAYPWSSAGFGVKFTDPATLPTGLGYGVDFSPAGTELAIAHATSPYVTAYPWSSAGFGTKFTNPATLPTAGHAGRGAAFSPAGTELAITHTDTPHVTAYPWSSAGFGNKFTNPATLPTGAGRGVDFTTI